MKYANTIGFVGDLHCGSLWGLHHKPHNTGQSYLLACWQHLSRSWPALDLLVLMGDLIDGKQRKADSTGLSTARLGDQVKIAIECLRPLAKRAKKILRVDGTPYHEDYHGALDALDLALGVAKTDQVQDIDLGGNILNVAHHPAGGPTLYMGTATDRENLWSMIAAFEGSVPNARWIVRAHKHTYLMQESRMRTIIQTPCWQLATPHCKKQNYHRFQPSLGAVLMQTDARHHSGYAVLPTLYDPPKLEVQKYAEIREAESARAVSD